jgi:hypothetical protein
MKVLNLQCARQHAFEGWFASEAEFQGQLDRGLLECPMCANTAIQKLPSAPRLNLGGREIDGSTANQVMKGDEGIHPDVSEPGRALEVATSHQIHVTTGQAAFLKALRELVANTEDVGSRFAEQARGMHYGDIEPRRIRGQTSAEQAIELLEEGIDVMPLPIPDALKETLQ